MTRLLVHVEGQTEETFVNEVLAEHLYENGYTVVGARLFGNARQRARRGGVKPWQAVKRDVIRHLQEDDGAVSTLMVDYYAMPKSGDGAWPGRDAACALAHANKAALIQDQLYADIVGELGSDLQAARFVPFVLMHEFEALLFSDCVAFAKGVGRSDLAGAMQLVRNQFGSPEEINDSPATAPSKRVELLIEGYQKTFVWKPCRA
ncbi:MULTISPECIES: DUF4276 family protein [unclassified Pseudoxanthomonas]|uniref:DUF4276 family protein n=1 Tax=unclassified Pseudoxanthomonas TaxID=2645906 RepID=UPI0030785160